MQDRSIKYLDSFLFGTYLIFLFSIIFSLRAVSSIAIGLILIAALLRNKHLKQKFFNKEVFSLFVTGCLLLFLLQSLSLLYTTDIAEGLKLLQRSSALVFIPFAVSCSNSFLITEKRRKLLWYFSIFVSAASLYCLGMAFINYQAGAPASTFFYHDLVKPILQHAIQFSILVFIALVFLIESHKTNLSKYIIVLLSAVLILLSSKLVICFYVCYLVWFFSSKHLLRSNAFIAVLLFVGMITTVLTTSNPVSNRFKEIFSGNSLLFEQKKFDPGIYFNGVQFRLLQWRFTYEILSEHHAWVLGLSPGDAQTALDKKYVETNMYTGVPGTDEKGFLGYHTHNQFLQCLLENGILGLLIFLLIFCSLITMAVRSKSRVLKSFVLLILIYCFADAPLETQYGLVIFTFFPVFLYEMKERKKEITIHQAQSTEVLVLDEVSLLK